MTTKPFTTGLAATGSLTLPGNLTNKLARLDQAAVYLAHSSDLMLAGLSASLPAETKICGKYTSASELLKALARCPDSGVLFLDDQLDVFPIALVRQVLTVAPRMRIILLSRLSIGIYMEALFHAGAQGFLCTTEPLEEALYNALQVVANGWRYLSLIASAHYVVFTVDQGKAIAKRDSDESEAWQTLILLMNGCNVSDSAKRMGISVAKVYRLHRRLRDWFGVETNVELVRQAFLFGFGAEQ